MTQVQASTTGDSRRIGVPTQLNDTEYQQPETFKELVNLNSLH